VEVFFSLIGLHITPTNDLPFIMSKTPIKTVTALIPSKIIPFELGLFSFPFTNSSVPSSGSTQMAHEETSIVDFFKSSGISNFDLSMGS
jgi:hypothetical protein